MYIFKIGCVLWVDFLRNGDQFSSICVPKFSMNDSTHLWNRWPRWEEILCLQRWHSYGNGPPKSSHHSHVLPTHVIPSESRILIFTCIFHNLLWWKSKKYSHLHTEFSVLNRELRQSSLIGINVTLSWETESSDVVEKKLRRLCFSILFHWTAVRSRPIPLWVRHIGLLILLGSI